ncbi:MAG TPA: ABC transporter permease, partial [Burkholderiales bacterium]|nr:ABC transporter permease [Burkholderiales bacterium]
MEGTVGAFVLALTALGLSLVFGVMRIVNVAHGEFFMLGAVLAWFCASRVESPLGGFVFALVVAPLVVGALAYAADGLVLRRVDYHPESTIVATIGLLYIIQQAVLTLYGPDARPVAPPVYFKI